MRVLHIVGPSQHGQPGSSPYGGLQRFLDELIPEQQRLGIEVLVHRAKDRQLDGGELQIREISPDVVHFHDWYGGMLLPQLYCAGFRSSIFTSHLPLRRGFTYRDVGLDWQSKMLFESRLLGAAKLITCPSRYVEKFLVAEYSQSAGKIRVIPHGVNSDFFVQYKGGLNVGNGSVLAVGRLTSQKAFDVLVRSWTTVLELLPLARLTIAGDGECRESLERLVSRLHLAGAVTLAGPKSSAELAEHYRRAALLVIPSHFEPFGLVGLEAMACGCPVLAIGPSGASEYLLPDEQISDYSPRRLGIAIARHLGDLHRAPRAREAVRQRAAQKTWSAAASRYLEAYRETST